MALNLLLGVFALNIVFAFGTNERLFCQKVDGIFVDTSTSCRNQTTLRVTGVKGDTGTPGLKGEKGLPGFVDPQNVENVIEEQSKKANRKLRRRMDELEQLLAKINISISDVAHKLNCDDGFYYKGKCYFAIIPGEINHSAALNLCVAKHGIAADILNHEHEKLVADYIRSRRSRGIDLWLGMSYSTATSTLRWSTGDAVPQDVANAMQWFSSYPSTGNVLWEHVAIAADSRDYGFRNIPSSDLYGVMCEM